MKSSIFGFLTNFIVKKIGFYQDSVEERDLKQDLVNRQFVSKIFIGNYKYIAPKKIILLNALFTIWQTVQKKMFLEAPKEKHKLRRKFIKNNNFSELNVHFSYELPKVDSEIFMQDVFTEPFSSTPDMNTWALVTQIYDIFLLKGIPLQESVKYIIYIKEYFANHQMVKAIIQFDIYKKK